MFVSFDVETYPIAVGARLPQVVCASYCFEGDTPGILLGDECERFISAVIKDSRLTLVNHNMAFDMGAMATTWPWLHEPIVHAYETSRILCTMRWSQLVDYAIGRNAKRYSLGAVCDRLGIEHADKDTSWRYSYHKLDGVPLDQWPDEAIEYSLLDATAPLELARALRKVPDVAEQSKWYYWLTLSSAYGLRTDTPKVQQWAADKRTKRDALEGRLRSILHTDSTGATKRTDGKAKRNMKALHAEIERAYGGNPPRNPPTAKALAKDPNAKGSIKADYTTCIESGDPFLKDYAAYNRILSALSRELPILENEYVHTRYDLAETGRSTSSKPNLQNLNKTSGSRDCFAPRNGMVYCIADYGRLELSTLAQICVALGLGDKLASAIRSGDDPHNLMAAAILGLPMREAMKHPDWKKSRQASKCVNFGYPGGMGARSFVDYALSNYEVRITLTESKRLRKLWRRQWPDCVAYTKRIGQLLEAHCDMCGKIPDVDTDICMHCNSGTIRRGTLDHYRTGRLRGGLRYTQGCNTLFQGLGGDVTKAAGWELMKAGFLPVVFVHDEYVCEVPRASAIDAAHEIQRILEDTAREWLPDAPSKAEPVLATRWVKDDPLIVDGQLQIIEAA